MSYEDKINIDDILKRLDDLEHHVGFDGGSTLAEQFGKVTGDLSYIYDNLIDFNGELVKFNTDNDEFGVRLSSLKNNLSTFLDGVTDLTESVNVFDAQLNGDDENDGFIDYLDQLESYMYGKGETYIDSSNIEHDCDYQHPSPTSLKGLLNTLGDSLSNLSDGDTQLAFTLSTLSDKLSGFQGTLQEFQSEIEDEVDSEVYQALNSELIKLIYEIATSNTKLEEHQQTIQDVEDLIGSSTDSASQQEQQGEQVTVLGRINDTSDLATTTSESAIEIKETLFLGDGTGSIGEPADNTIMGDLKTLSNYVGEPSDSYVNNDDNTVFGYLNDSIESVDTIKEDIGDVSELSNDIVSEINKNITDIQSTKTSLNSLLSPSMDEAFEYVYVTDGDVNGTEIKLIEDTYGVTIRFAYSYYDGKYYKKTNNQWSITYENPSLVEVGICSEYYRPSTVTGNERFAYIYDIDSKTYRYIETDDDDVLGHYGHWEYYDGLPDFFMQTELYSSIATHFALSNHKHTKSQITDFTHTHTKSDIDDFAHTHSKSEISNFSHTHPVSDISNLSTTLNDKQDNIGTMNYIGGFTAYGVRVEWFSDGLYVYVTFNGDLSHGTMPRESDASNPNNVISADYRPYNAMKSPIAPNTNGYILELTTGGRVRYWGSTSNDSTVNTSLMYPLKSRF